MVDRVEQRFAIKPKRLVGDTAYGTGAMLAWMVQEEGIDPHVPVWQRPPRNDGTFPNSVFAGSSKATNVAAQQAMLSARSGDRSKHSARTSRRPARSSIDPVRQTALHAQ
jgi:hypothetical protein